MKKRILALLTVLAVLLSMLAFASCDKGSSTDDETNNGETNGDGDKGDKDGSGDEKNELDLDESVNGNGNSSNGVYIVSDPTNPEAGSGVEDKYSGDHN